MDLDVGRAEDLLSHDLLSHDLLSHDLPALIPENKQNRPVATL